MSAYQGAMEGDSRQAYFDEFAFRLNRRPSEFRRLLFRRLLEQGVPVGPVSYCSLVVTYPRASHLYPQEVATGFERTPSQQP